MNEEVNNANQISDCPGNYEYSNDRFGSANSAIYFTGNDCSCRNDFDVSHFPALNNFTVAYWSKVKVAGDDTKILISIKQTLGFDDLNVIYVLHNLELSYYSNSVLAHDFKTDPSTVQDTWNHFAFVRNSGQKTGYVNGEVVFSGVDNAPSSLTAVIFTIGSDSQYPLCARNIYLDDLRIYDRGLSVAEVKELMKNIQIFLSSCVDAGKNTSDFVDYTLDSQNICAKNTCVEAVQSIQQSITIPNQASVDTQLTLEDLLGYQIDCFDLYTKLSTDTAGPGDLNILNVSTIEGCISPCNVDFTFSFKGTSHALFRTTVPISFTRTSSTVLTNLSSSGSPTFPQVFPETTVSTTLLTSAIQFATFEVRKQQDYSTNDSTDPILKSYAYYVFTTQEPGLNLTKSDISVKLINPSDKNSSIDLSSNEFDLENGIAADSYNLRIKGKIIGTYKVLVEKI